MEGLDVSQLPCVSASTVCLCLHGIYVCLCRDARSILQDGMLDTIRGGKCVFRRYQFLNTVASLGIGRVLITTCPVSCVC